MKHTLFIFTIFSLLMPLSALAHEMHSHHTPIQLHYGEWQPLPEEEQEAKKEDLQDRWKNLREEWQEDFEEREEASVAARREPFLSNRVKERRAFRNMTPEEQRAVLESNTQNISAYKPSIRGFNE